MTHAELVVMKRQVLHVAAFAEGWRVLTESGARASELFLERDDAEIRAVHLVEAFGWGKVIVHSRRAAPHVIRFGRPSAS